MAKQSEIKKIGILSLGKIGAVVSFLFGIILSIFLAIMQKVTVNLPTMQQLAQQLNQMTTSTLLILPFWYAFIGFLWGIVIAAVYNIVAKYIGGVKINLV